MAETKTTERERTERTTEQAFRRAEDTATTVAENGRRTFQSMIEFQRNNLNTSMQMMRDIQEESLRFTDAVFNQMAKYSQNNIRMFQDYSTRVQDYTEKTMKEGQQCMEDTVEQTLELVTPGAARSTRR